MGSDSVDRRTASHPRRGASRRWLLVGLVGLVGVLAGAVMVGLVSAGVLYPNNPSSDRFPVRGVDVSRYQGVIDWPVLASQGIEFAFIKATEGSSYVDPMFRSNLAGASAAGLRTGAYHFFSFESPGATQADNILRNVPADPALLPVVIDLEFYDEFWTGPAPVTQVRHELTILLDRLAERDGGRPILYTTVEAYDRYIAGAFPDLDIWIRDVWREPSLADGRGWTFWQYSDRGRLHGYSGEEQFIDLNTYAGSRAEWEAYDR